MTNVKHIILSEQDAARIQEASRTLHTLITCLRTLGLELPTLTEAEELLGRMHTQIEWERSIPIPIPIVTDETAKTTA